MKAEITKNSIVDTIVTCISNELEIPRSQIDTTTEFVAMGIDSIQGVMIIKTVEEKLGITINPVLFFDYPTIEELSEKLIES